MYKNEKDYFRKDRRKSFVKHVLVWLFMITIGVIIIWFGSGMTVERFKDATSGNPVISGGYGYIDGKTEKYKVMNMGKESGRYFIMIKNGPVQKFYCSEEVFNKFKQYFDEGKKITVHCISRKNDLVNGKAAYGEILEVYDYYYEP